MHLLPLHACTGIVGTMKAVISEASDDRTQAFGITILTGAWGLGFILGPAISGAIADPIGQYNLTISSELPELIIAAIPRPSRLCRSAWYFSYVGDIHGRKVVERT